MKRTATTLALLAGFGGGCASPGGTAKTEPAGFGTVTRGKPIGGYQGPNGEPVLAAAARGAAPESSPIQPVIFRKAGTPSAADCNTCAHVPGGHGLKDKSGGHFGHGGLSHGGFGPGGPGYPPGPPGGGILPVPGQGPPGGVAGVGALVGAGGNPAVANGRASVRFTGPAGMKVTWQIPGGGFLDEAGGLTAPKEYNFVQGQVYRLRLTQILPTHPGRSFYPTLEIAPANPKTVTFLAHASVPITFTADDFDQAIAGNLVVKVVYLPDRENQDYLTVAGAEELNSTRLEPGADPVAEAQRRGSVLAIIRLGNIDLENRTSPAINAPPGGFGPPPGAVMMPPPGAGGPAPLPPGGGLMKPPAPPGGQGGLPPGTSNLGGRPNLAPPAAPTAPSGPVAPGPLPPAVGGKPAMLPPVK
ncbi:MAG: hypothetical protein C0501_15075 [Isosphaera sp.]|nr:hypothetical protein [Isosphaera sp.]